jgi:hypothetical protein
MGFVIGKVALGVDLCASIGLVIRQYHVTNSVPLTVQS